MKELKTFSEFVKESREELSPEEVQSLLKIGVMNDPKEIELEKVNQVFELCPNLKYVTIPHFSSPGSSSRVYNETPTGAERRSVLAHLEKLLKEDDRAELRVWNMGGYGLDSRKGEVIPRMDPFRYDLGEVIDYLEANPEVAKKVSHFQIQVDIKDSEEHEEFARDMAAGRYGSLD